MCICMHVCKCVYVCTDLLPNQPICSSICSRCPVIYFPTNPFAPHSHLVAPHLLSNQLICNPFTLQPIHLHLIYMQSHPLFIPKTFSVLLFDCQTLLSTPISIPKPFSVLPFAFPKSSQCSHFHSQTLLSAPSFTLKHFSVLPVLLSNPRRCSHVRSFSLPNLPPVLPINLSHLSVHFSVEPVWLCYFSPGRGCAIRFSPSGCTIPYSQVLWGGEYRRYI
jgi:hypothetical protein